MQPNGEARREGGRKAVVCLLVAMFAAQAVFAQVELDKMHAAGYPPNMGFENAFNVDVNTFNGAITIRENLGINYTTDGGLTWGLPLRYTTPFSVNTLTDRGSVQGEFTHSWSFDFGFLRRYRVMLPTMNSTGYLIDRPQMEIVTEIVDENGTATRLFLTSHPSRGGANIQFRSADGPFVKAVFNPASGEFTTYFPDGLRRVYQMPAGGTDLPYEFSARYPLIRMEDRFGNAVRVTYETDGAGALRVAPNGADPRFLVSTIGDGYREIRYEWPTSDTGDTLNVYVPAEPGHTTGMSHPTLGHPEEKYEFRFADSWQVWDLVSVTLPPDQHGVQYQYQMNGPNITFPTGASVEVPLDNVIVFRKAINMLYMPRDPAGPEMIAALCPTGTTTEECNALQDEITGCSTKLGSLPSKKTIHYPGGATEDVTYTWTFPAPPTDLCAADAGSFQPLATTVTDQLGRKTVYRFYARTNTKLDGSLKSMEVLDTDGVTVLRRTEYEYASVRPGESEGGFVRWDNENELYMFQAVLAQTSSQPEERFVAAVPDLLRLKHFVRTKERTTYFDAQNPDGSNIVVEKDLDGANPWGEMERTAVASNRAGGAFLAALDGVAPETALERGQNGRTWRKILSFRWTGSDNTTSPGNLQFAYKLVKSGGTDPGWGSFSPDTTASYRDLTAGTYTFYVKARDLAGNEDATPATTTFYTTAHGGNPWAGDPADPATTITGTPPAPTRPFHEISFSWTGTDTFTPTDQLVYSWYLSGTGLTGATWGPYAADTATGYGKLAEGSYTFHVRAKDLNGRVDGTPATYTFSVSTSGGGGGGCKFGCTGGGSGTLSATPSGPSPGDITPNGLVIHRVDETVLLHDTIDLWMLNLPRVTLRDKNLLSVTDYNTDLQPEKTVQVGDVISCIPDTTADSCVTGSATKVSTAYTYNAFGEVETVAVTDETGKTYSTTKTYTAGKLATEQITNLPYKTVDITYDVPSGREVSAREPNQVEATYQWDRLGRLIQATVGGETPIEVDYVDPQESHYRKGTVEARNFFDEAGRRVRAQVILADGSFSEVKTVYDAAGRVTFTSEPYAAASPPATPVGTTTTYDRFDRPITVTAADNAVTTYAYSGDFKTSSTVNVDGSDATTTQYMDALGRLILVDAPEGADGVYHYNNLDNLIRVNLVDTVGATPVATYFSTAGYSNNQIRTFTYDQMSRLRSATNPENGTVDYLQYDALGNALLIQDAKGKAGNYKVKFTYDNVGRLQQVDRVNAANNAVEFILGQLEYDLDHTGGNAASKPLSKVTRIKSYQRDPKGASNYGLERVFWYTGLNGRLGHTETVYTLPAAAGQTPKTIQGTLDYFYTALGELATLDFHSAQSTAIHGYTYVNGYLTNQTFTVNGQDYNVVPEVDYNAAGGVKEILFGNGVDNVVNVDARYRPASITSTNAASQVLFDSGTYQYDAAGNILKIGDEEFHYDKISRLTSAKVLHRGLSVFHQIAYAYDNFGNMTNRTLTNAGTLFPSATEEENKYLADLTITNRSYTGGTAQAPVYDNRIHDAGFVYDVNGNTLQDEEHKYVWDELNRLVEIQNLAGQTLARHVYDTGNERVIKVDWDPAANQETAGTVYYRDESGMVQFETTETQSADLVARQHRAYGYVMGKVAFQADFRDQMNLSNYGTYSDCDAPAIEDVQFITRPNGYDAVIPVQANCFGDDLSELVFTLYERKHADNGQSTNSNAWDEREAYTVVVQGGVAVPNSVVFPHLLYDRSYRCLMTVKTDANTTGLFGAATLTTSEATWNVPKDERKSYVAAVRDGRDGHVSLWWQPAADTYYVYRTNGNGTRTLLTGEPLSQPGVNLDEEALFAAGVDPLDLFEVDGLSGAGLTVLGGTPNPGVIPPPGGGGGGPGPISDCVISCTASGCTITGPKSCHLPGRTAVSIVYFSTDHLGTPRAVSDSNGNLLSQHDYEPFGLEIPAYTASSHTHRFTGHERDAGVGLDYMGARFYSGALGRFLSVDPERQMFNPYSYGKNNPVSFFDPDGRLAIFFLGWRQSLKENAPLHQAANELPESIRRKVIKGSGLLPGSVSRRAKDGLEATKTEMAAQKDETVEFASFSHGAHSAVKAAGDYGGPIDLLLTIDPELRSTVTAPANVKVAVNITDERGFAQTGEPTGTEGRVKKTEGSQTEVINLAVTGTKSHAGVDNAVKDFANALVQATEGNKGPLSRDQVLEKVAEFNKANKDKGVQLIVKEEKPAAKQEAKPE